MPAATNQLTQTLEEPSGTRDRHSRDWPGALIYGAAFTLSISVWLQVMPFVARIPMSDHNYMFTVGQDLRMVFDVGLER